MRYLPFVLLLGLACSKAPESRTDDAARTARAGCEAATHGIEDGAFAAAGDSGAAVATEGFTLARDGTCRSIALALAGSAAVRGEFMRSYGVVRLTLPRGLERIDDADTTFADPLAAAAYVVHGRDGGYHLDVHLAQPALALARAEAGRLEVELAPGGGAVPTAAPRARNVVVLEPRQGTARYPLVVRGYARTFEANVQAWITGSPETKTFTTAADWMTTWGEFELTIPSGPSGDIQLFVGEESAQDGTPIGVTIPLRMP